MKRHAAPILAAILLLLPVLYVGSYLVLAVPGGLIAVDAVTGKEWVYPHRHYRVDPRVELVAATVFWPLEQIDRKVRPGEWELERGGGG
jgi:hypothetical protein